MTRRRLTAGEEAALMIACRDPDVRRRWLTGALEELERRLREGDLDDPANADRAASAARAVRATLAPSGEAVR